MPEKILIVDGNAVCYAAHYTSGQVLSHDNKKTGIIYGFFRQLQHACRVAQVAHVAFCWDSRQSLRKRIFSEYKSNRVKKDIDPSLIKSLGQFYQLREEILPRLGFINNFHKIGFEADDLIASLCKYPGPDKKETFIIMSGDQDLYQLLSDRISLYKLNKKRLYDIESFISEYKISPDKWGLVKAIAGCVTDTVPGVPSIGEKRAIAYLKEHNHNPKIDNPDAQAIIERNKKLVILPFDGTPRLTLDWSKNPSYAEWILLCEELAFNSFLKDSKTWESLFTGTPPQAEFRNKIKMGKLV